MNYVKIGGMGIMAKQSKEERSRNIKLIVGVLILSLGASLIWMYFAGAFDFILGNGNQNKNTSSAVSAVSSGDSSQVSAVQSSLGVNSQKNTVSIK